MNTTNKDGLSLRISTASSDPPNTNNANNHPNSCVENNSTLPLSEMSTESDMFDFYNQLIMSRSWTLGHLASANPSNQYPRPYSHNGNHSSNISWIKRTFTLFILILILSLVCLYMINRVITPKIQSLAHDKKVLKQLLKDEAAKVWEEQRKMQNMTDTASITPLTQIQALQNELKVEKQKNSVIVKNMTISHQNSAPKDQDRDGGNGEEEDFPDVQENPEEDDDDIQDQVKGPGVKASKKRRHVRRRDKGDDDEDPSQELSKNSRRKTRPSLSAVPPDFWSTLICMAWLFSVLLSLIFYRICQLTNTDEPLKKNGHLRRVHIGSHRQQHRYRCPSKEDLMHSRRSSTDIAASRSSSSSAMADSVNICV